MDIQTTRKEDVMRDMITKMTLILLGIFLCVSTAPADDTEQERERLQNREMIHAGIPDHDAENMNRMMIKNHFNHQNRIKARQIVMDAAKQGLPFQAVMNKAYEGVAKNAPAEAIVNAMEKIRHRYAYAYEKAQQITDDRQQIKHIGQSIVDSLKAGLSNEDADRIMLALQQHTRQMNRSQAEELAGESFQTAGTMARLGVDSALITDIACQAIQDNYSAEKMRQLKNRFRAEAMNTPPAIVAGQFRYSIQEGMMAGQLEAGHQYGSSGSNKGRDGHSADNSGGSGHTGAIGSGGSGGSGAAGAIGSGSSGSSGGTGSIGTGSSGGAAGSGGSGGAGGSGGSGGSRGPGSSKSKG